ncbi:MAG: IS1595 family transposase [Massilia sp.]
MQRAAFNTWLSLVPELTARQRERLCLQLAELVSGDQVAALVDQSALAGLACPRCAKCDLYRDGKTDGLQRYRCKQCGRSFNGLTGTPLARLRHKTRWLAYIDCLRDPACTVRSAADQTGIHKNTSFRWRHRFLELVKHDRPRCLQGIAEIGELKLARSFKGVRQADRPRRTHGGAAHRSAGKADDVTVVIARDRASQTVDFIIGEGLPDQDALRLQLLPVLERDILLVSATPPRYRRFARQAQIEYRCAGRTKKVTHTGAIHIHHVSDYQWRFTGWLAHFNGVATRYLSNYLGWRWAIDCDRISSAEDFLRLALRVTPT